MSSCCKREYGVFERFLDLFYGFCFSFLFCSQLVWGLIVDINLCFFWLVCFTACSMPWSNQGGDNPWRWQGVNQNSELKDSPIHYYQMPPCKNVDGSVKDSCSKKVI